MCRSKVNPSQSVVCDISIIISSYNASHNLNICLKQLLQQSIINRAEIIVIDSGSEQDESDICSQFACIFPALIYERTERESLYAAWNRGLSKARGLYFVNVNTDDALAPDALEGFVRALENDASAALAYADCVWSPVPNAQYPWPNSWKAVCYESYSALTTLFYCFTGCNQFWRTSSLRELGGFNPLLRAVGDYEILCRMATQRMKAIHIPRALSAFYQNPKGLSQISSAANEEFLTVRSKFRQKINLSNIFAISAPNDVERRGAHLHLALRALEVHIPWHVKAVPDVDYAVENLHAAAALSSFARRRMIRFTASMVARSSLGSAISHKAAQVLLSPLGLLLLHGRPLPAKL